MSELSKIQSTNLSLSKSNMMPSVSKGKEKDLNLSLSLLLFQWGSKCGGILSSDLIIPLITPIEEEIMWMSGI